MKYIFCVLALFVTSARAVEIYAHDRYRDFELTNSKTPSIGNTSFTTGIINGSSYTTNTVSAGNTSFSYGHVSGNCNININTTSYNVGNTTYTHGFVSSPNCGLLKIIYGSHPNIYDETK